MCSQLGEPTLERQQLHTAKYLVQGRSARLQVEYLRQRGGYTHEVYTHEVKMKL
jgi:hypothetical protein